MKIKKLHKLILALYLIAHIAAVGYIILNAWNTAVGMVEQEFLKLIVIKPAMAYKALRLEEMPVEAQVWRLAKQYGVDADLALKIAACESGFQSNAKSPLSSATGIFQFIDSTWISARQAMGQSTKTDLELRKNSVENIKTAMFLLGKGQISHWNASKNCWS